MIKVENIDLWGFEHAVRGMRNPMNSWNKSDSCYTADIPEDVSIFQYYPDWKYKVGKNDLALMHRLFEAGTEHRKYLRQIFVSMDITAPLYWWKEFDTYKIGVTANSCSTMHTIHTKEFTMDDFSHEHCLDNNMIWSVVYDLNKWRKLYLETKDKKYWWQMIQLLPSSYNQRRTVTMNYENVFNIIYQRSAHKLDEWKEYTVILADLPYVDEIAKGYSHD